MLVMLPAFQLHARLGKLEGLRGDRAQLLHAQKPKIFHIQAPLNNHHSIIFRFGVWGQAKKASCGSSHRTNLSSAHAFAQVPETRLNLKGSIGDQGILNSLGDAHSVGE